MILTGRERVLVSGVSPTGGLASVAESVTTQDIANLGAGGFGSLTALGVAVSGAFGGSALPANSYLGPLLLLRETAGHAATVAIGTALGGNDVLPAVNVSASSTITVDVTAFSKGWFSSTATQTLFLTITGAGAVINAQLFYVIGQA